jgi:hypothetical protein
VILEPDRKSIMAKAKPDAGRASGKNVPVRELVLDGKGRVRLRKASPAAWTKTKEQQFLEALSETCNVKWAARESGVSPQRAYERRKSHAAFRAGWIEAIGKAYNRLELILLDRALNGTERIITRKDGSQERMVDYSNRVALTLLKMHRDTAIEADSELPSEDIKELREKISRKLDRLKQQEEQREAGTGGGE